MDILENSSWSLSKEILSITPQQSEHLSFSLHLTPLKLTACTWNYGWLVDEVSFCDGLSSGASGEMFVFGCVFSSMAFFVGNLWFFGHVWFQSTCRTCLWSQKHISWRDDEIPSTPPAPWWQLWQHRKHFTLQDSCALYSPVNLQECWTGLPRFHKSRASRRTGAPEFWMPCRALESLQGLQEHLSPAHSGLDGLHFTRSCWGGQYNDKVFGNHLCWVPSWLQHITGICPSFKNNVDKTPYVNIQDPWD